MDSAIQSSISVMLRYLLTLQGTKDVARAAISKRSIPELLQSLTDGCRHTSHGYLSPESMYIPPQTTPPSLLHNQGMGVHVTQVRGLCRPSFIKYKQEHDKTSVNY